MFITRENVAEYLKNGMVKTSMVYPITSEKHYIVLEELTIKLSNEEIIKIPKSDLIFHSDTLQKLVGEKLDYLLKKENKYKGFNGSVLVSKNDSILFTGYYGMADFKEKKQIFSDCAEGKIDILIGTHALLSDKLRFKNLGLIIYDEEQKLGTLQKEKFNEKHTMILLRILINILPHKVT